MLVSLLLALHTAEAAADEAGPDVKVGRCQVCGCGSVGGAGMDIRMAGKWKQEWRREKGERERVGRCQVCGCICVGVLEKGDDGKGVKMERKQIKHTLRPNNTSVKLTSLQHT